MDYLQTVHWDYYLRYLLPVVYKVPKQPCIGSWKVPKAIKWSPEGTLMRHAMGRKDALISLIYTLKGHLGSFCYLFLIRNMKK